MGDELYFYCSGRNSGRDPDDGSGGATGLVILRRDGFASMDAGKEAGTLTTRPVTFSGNHLYANVDFDGGGELRAEILDAKTGEPLAPFTSDNCRPVRQGGTRVELGWDGAPSLATLAGKPVRVRFHLRNGGLYAFWISPDPSGAGNGYVAGGGPGFTGNRDTPR